MAEVTLLVPLHQRPLHERVAATVRAETARHGVRQRQMAELLGLTQQSVSGKLKGSTPFTLDELAVVAPLLGKSVTALLAESENGPRPGITQDEDRFSRPRRESNPHATGSLFAQVIDLDDYRKTA